MMIPRDYVMQHSYGSCYNIGDACGHQNEESLRMSLQDLESAVSRLSPPELTAFSQWFEEFLADAWDRQIEKDVRAGRLDEAGGKADEHFEAGRCTPL